MLCICEALACVSGKTKCAICVVAISLFSFMSLCSKNFIVILLVVWFFTLTANVSGLGEGGDF